MLNAYATVTFEGNAVGVYGTTSTNHGFFHVSLDDSAPIKLNGTIPDDQPAPRYQNLLVSSLNMDWRALTQALRSIGLAACHSDNIL